MHTAMCRPQCRRLPWWTAPRGAEYHPLSCSILIIDYVASLHSHADETACTPQPDASPNSPRFRKARLEKHLPRAPRIFLHNHVSL
jgi:hypothetical protein